VDAYGNPMYASAPSDGSNAGAQFYTSQPLDANAAQGSIPTTASLGTLSTSQASMMNLNKTDSHAVLMELFARDQDLVRQATESARLKAEQSRNPAQQSGAGGQGSQQQQSQHPMKAPSQAGLPNVPTLNSWPHFSSINSLNNLGTIPGVKSITSLSGADLVGKGNVGKMGNLAQVKSIESMGKNDSYAFLEVFFGDRSSATNLSGMAGGGGGGGGGGSRDSSKGMKASGGEEDNEIGLSLEDESPSHGGSAKKEFPCPQQSSCGGSQPSPMGGSAAGQESSMESGTLKRAYDDAMAARGLISVSRSCEKLTELPAKMQRTLSQEFIGKQQEAATSQQQQQQGQQAPPQTSQLSYGQYGGYVSTALAPSSSDQQSGSPQQQQQYPGQQPGEPQGEFMSDSHETDGHVKVSATTICALCQQTNVDTQLRPCGHMFHERCLKPSLQTPMGQPKCPVDDVPMLSAVLAVPTEDGGNAPQSHQQPVKQESPWNYSATVHNSSS